MSSASLKFVIEGDPAPAVKAMRTVTGEAQKSSTSIGASFKKLASVGAGLVGAAGLASFFKSSIAQAEEAQKVAGQTAAVILSTGSAANVTAGHVDDLANSISKYAGIDDEAIASAENMLLTFTNVRNEVGKGNDVFDQATKAATDMSVGAGDGRDGRGEDVGDRAERPGEGDDEAAEGWGDVHSAAEGPGRADGGEQQHDGRAESHPGELSKEFGGSAAAQATASDKMKVALGNLEEEVGQALLPVIEGLANFLTDDVIPAFSAVVGWVKDNQTTVKVLAGTIAGLWAAYKGYKILTAVSAAVSLATAKYAQFVAQMSYGNRVQRTASSGLQNLGKIAVGAAVVVALVAKAWMDNAAKQARAKAEMQELTDAITADNGAVGDNTREVQANKLEQAGIYEIAQRAGIGLNLVTDAALGNTEAQKKLRAQLGPAAAELKISGSEAQKLGVYALAMGGKSTRRPPRPPGSTR
jgi:cell division protein FtsL